jgi:lincosamide nucleotidyltransferase A/C/D/E
MTDLCTGQESHAVEPALPLDVAVAFIVAATNDGIDLWIDGGWGVDALLGEQTRAHADLDIVVEQCVIPRLRSWLEMQGFHDVEREDTSPWNFVLGDDAGHQIDIHAIVFDEEGNGLYGPPERGVMYPAASLTGTGTIGGLVVKCISPEWLVAFHTGYELRDTDYHDVDLLCRRFGIAPPEEYAGLREQK